MATVLYVLLILAIFLGCCTYSLSLTFLTVLALVLSTSFPFIFSKINQLRNAGSIKEPPKRGIGQEILPGDEVVGENKPSQEEGGELQIDGSTDSTPPEHDDPRSDPPSPDACWLLDGSIATEELNVNLIQSAGSEGSLSDEDSLIEIALPDGRYGLPEEPNTPFPKDLREGDFIPESVFGQHGLMELLTEMSEEDNLIEIDIVMGSIKCSSFELKA